MTLITFQSRIHFASDVLEEAVRAEFEESGHRRVLVICEDPKVDDDLLERVQMSLPNNISHEIITLDDHQNKQETAHFALGYEAEGAFDAIIGCGSSRAIAHSRKSQHALSQARFAALPKEQRTQNMQRKCLPDFYAIPGVDGLPDPCLSGGATARYKKTPPNVIICDPTVMAQAGPSDIANVFATSLGRCLGTFAVSSFNPIADGMAVEGLRRLATILPLVHENKTDIAAHRDLMAASLIGSISQQKGPGLVQAIADTLMLITDSQVDTGSLQRILLPRLLRDLQLISTGDKALILRVFDWNEDVSLSKCVEDIFDPLPLNRSLSDMGFALKELKQAISTTRERIHLSVPVTSQIQTIVEDVY